MTCYGGDTYVVKAKFESNAGLQYRLLNRNALTTESKQAEPL